MWEADEQYLTYGPLLHLLEVRSLLFFLQPSIQQFEEEFESLQGQE